MFLNNMVFFVALAKARDDVNKVMNIRPTKPTRRSRSSNFTNRSRSRAQPLQNIEQPTKPKPYGWFQSKKVTPQHADEPFEVDNAKREIAKFFKQDDPGRFFKPIVDVLKVELLKAKQLELKEQTRTDASDEIKELEGEIRKLKP